MSTAAFLDDINEYISFSTLLYATLSQIAVYVTETLLPVLASIFWWNPWVIGGVIVAVIAAVVVWQVLEASKNDPYARPNQKKQGRERKEKKRNDKWKPNPNKKPEPPKKHTPGRDHQKYPQ